MAAVAVVLTLGGSLAACHSPADDDRGTGSDDRVATDSALPTTTGTSAPAPVTDGADPATDTSATSGDTGPTTSSVRDNFNRADGPVDNGWAATNPAPAIRGGVLSTAGSRALLAVHRDTAAGFDPNGDWRIDVDVVAPVRIGHGGATVYVGSAGRTGYSVFIGNAVHIQRQNADGSHQNLTNDDRSGGGTGVRADHVTWIHRANGDHEVYLNGQLRSFVNDRVPNPGGHIGLLVQNTDAPDQDCTIDNLVMGS